ncbi:hypothetical protein [Haloferax sp. DFSO60]|uniref:hypothetical protein n=1 Tax=Haloferax sp. DFSO60 TaxID=3388652 RepID=UPI00397D37EA
MDGDEQFHDPIAAALLSDSTYERLRVRRRSLFKQPLSRKLAWQSGILAALGLIVPLSLLLPTSTRTLFPPGDILWSSPKILLLGAYAGTIVTVSALALAYVGYRRVTASGALSEREASRLLNIEDVASLISLITGLSAIVAINGIFILGQGGDRAMSMFFAAGGENPFAATTIPVSVVGVGGAAIVAAVFIFALSRVFARRLAA